MTTKTKLQLFDFIKVLLAGAFFVGTLYCGLQIGNAENIRGTPIEGVVAFSTWILIFTGLTLIRFWRK